MEQDHLLAVAAAFAQHELGSDASGHDWWHTWRVAESAKIIAKETGADPFICELAALLHDVADEKLNESKESGLRKVSNWLKSRYVMESDVQHVMDIIETMSFNGGSNPPMKTLEGQVVQDADRLDAIGALGIARVFAYAGAKKSLIHEPGRLPRAIMTQEQYRNEKNTAIQHFYEKLLKLKDLMNTPYAKSLAEQRHRYMEEYLNRFYLEWEGKA